MNTAKQNARVTARVLLIAALLPLAWPVAVRAQAPYSTSCAITTPAVSPCVAQADAVDTAPARTGTSIPCSQPSTSAAAAYHGDGLDIVPIPQSGSVRLRCLFQRLEAEATREGLWLTSALTNGAHDRFRVTAVAIGRTASMKRGGSKRESVEPSPPAPCSSAQRLSDIGTVEATDQLVRFVRPGIIEEYSVSLDGVRQDFIVQPPPLDSQPLTLNPQAGDLVLRLAVTGARVEQTASGAQLVLANSGRKIAYSRLRVTDAMGKELPARMEVPDKSEIRIPKSELVSRSDVGLTVVVNDTDAVYPVRIDPTFSDANWTSMGGLLGANERVQAMVVDGSGNLYIGGWVTVVGNVIANSIAKWDGTNWSALGSGMSDARSGFMPFVRALAVSGGDLYAGGGFTTAGGQPASSIAKWDGSNWSALESGMYGSVFALAVSGSDLYAGGEFSTAGGQPAIGIAKWNGSNWSALGSGLDGSVYALAVSGSTVYAGGGFSTAGGQTANRIAKWNGTSWTALGSGMNGSVFAVAVAGSTVYAGGSFTSAGGTPAQCIAKWNGSSWSALGSGMGSGFSPEVYALAVSGSTVYAVGFFTTAGGTPANAIAKWNGSSWSALGSGMGDGSFYPYVYALAVSGSNVYAGGAFTTAGGTAANYIAKWDGKSWSVLGSGMNNAVRALTVAGNDLYAGGDFITAGGKVSAYIAHAYLVRYPTISLLRSGPDLTVSWPSADAAGFLLEQAEALAAPASWVTNSTTVNDDGTNKWVTLSATNSAQFCRLKSN